MRMDLSRGRGINSLAGVCPYAVDLTCKYELLLLFGVDLCHVDQAVA